MSKITINQDSLKTRREWKRHKILDGSNVYRILPPFGDVEVHNNYPYRKWVIAWMIDPKSGNRRPFATPETDGDGECPVKEYHDALSKFIESRKGDLEKAFKAKGFADKDIDEKVKGKLKPLREVQWKIKPQRLYAYNAANKSGEVGLLELKSTAHKDLKSKMAEYIRDYAQDPTCLGSDVEDNAGVWFNIKKEGMNTDTKYKAEFNEIKRKDNGKVVKEDDREPLPDNIVDNYDNLAYDLNSVYVRKTYEELKDILLYNLAFFAEQAPDCILEGYDISGIELKKTDEDQDDAVPVAKPVAKTTVAKLAVNLKLDDEDSDEDDDAPAPVQRQAAAKPAAALVAQAKSRKMTAEDDIFGMADNILNS